MLPDGTLIIHVIMILVMIWILNKTFFKPINKVLSTREKNKGGHSGEAQGILDEVAAKRAEYTSSLQDARNANYDAIENVRVEALADKQAKLDSAKNEIVKMLNDGNTELDSQVAAAKKAITDDAEKMAEKISSNLLKGVA